MATEEPILSNGSSKVSAPTIRIAVFRSSGEPPEIVDVASSDVRELVPRAAGLVHSAVSSLGGSLAADAIREVLDNLVRAGFRGASVSVLDGGNEVVVSDHGAPMVDDGRPVWPGFSTASEEFRDAVHCVGSGSSVLGESMTRLHGDMRVHQKLDGGTVITLRRGPALPQRADVLTAVPDEAPPARPRPGEIRLPPRAVQALLVMADGREFGPTQISHLVGCSLTTAHRDLTRLEQEGLVSYTSRGKRVITLAGREHVAAVLDGASGPQT